MRIFIDTEFTSVHVTPRLISVGLISEDGEHSFYAELSDTWTKRDCSEFVLEMVLPLLEGDSARITRSDLTLKLGRWLESFSEPVQLATDSPRWDWPLIQKIFEAPETWPANLVRTPMLLQLDTEAVEAAFVGGLRRHHALDDAIANRRAWLAVSRHRLGVAKGVFGVPDNIDAHNDEVLRAFDPDRHGGEAMAFEPRGHEVLAAHPGPLRFEFHYTVGEPLVFEFKDETEAQWAIHNEGDHLLEARRLSDDEVDGNAG